MAVDNTGKLCKSCKKDYYRETSLHDDLYGNVTCPKCKHQVKRYEEDKKNT